MAGGTLLFSPLDFRLSRKFSIFFRKPRKNEISTVKKRAIMRNHFSYLL
jgi:hypothetical protein